MRNEEIHNLLSTHIMMVLIRAIKQENEICDFCRKRERLEDFRNVGYINRRKDTSRNTVHGWKTVIYVKWLKNEELQEMEPINLTHGMTAVGLSWTPLIGGFGYTKLERFLDFLTC